MDATTLNNLWPKIEMKLPRWVSVALAILILITLAKVIVGFFDNSSNQVVIPTTSTNKSVKPQARANHDRKVAQLHLMGKPAPATSKKQVADAPETTLNLKLLGVLAGDEEYGYAIISSGGNKIKHYGLGDDVPGGATLHAVFSDRVILERDIRMETLRLPRAAKGFNRKVSSKKKRPAVTPQKSTTSDDSNFDSLGEFRQAIMKNPIRMTEFINITPFSDGDEFKGFKVAPGQSSDIFDQLGLVSGDLITSLNGIVLDNPNKGTMAMQALSTSSEITIIVMRDGTELTLLQDFSQ